jgi:hypothetical protein
MTQWFFIKPKALIPACVVTGALSEGFSSKIQGVDFKPYLDELEAAIAKALDATPRTDAQWDVTFSSVEAVISSQSRRLAKQLGMAGDPMLLFMLTSGMLITAWSAFAVRRVSLDTSSEFESRLEMEELVNSLSNSYTDLIGRAAAYAEIYIQR